MDRYRCLAVLGLCVSVTLVGTPAFAQRTTGTISGTVMDTTNSVMPGVTVTAVCSDTNLSAYGGDGRAGRLQHPRASDLHVYRPRGTSGFKTVSRETLVTANAVAKVDFRLEVGNVSETVNVEASRRLSSSPTS